VSQARNHHYVPACYLKHFAVPQNRYEGRLHVYDRITGRTFPNSPDKSAREKDFYRVEVDGEGPNLGENAYEALETRFAPTLARLIERGTFPTDETERGEMFAFVASQAVRTPRIRETQLRFYNDAAMLFMHTLADNKDVFMKKLREAEPGISGEDAEEMYATHLEFLNAKGAHVVMDQTTLVRNSLELAGEIADVLALRHWILGRPSDDNAKFITTDDPVHLQPAADPRRIHPLWSPGFGDANTNVLVPLHPGLLLIGLPHPHDRARIRLSRRVVAEVNGSLAYAAHRFVYCNEPSFEFVDCANAIVIGPTDALIWRDDGPSMAERMGFFTSPWPSRRR
jgi:hypothetical protein